MDLIYKEEFYKIKKACIQVRRKLGNGFLEKVYENALVIELGNLSFEIEAQKELLVYYDNEVIGKYYADIVVDNKIIIELKTCERITKIHKLQILNYLKATGYKLGIIINFPNESIGFEIERVPNFICEEREE